MTDTSKPTNIRRHFALTFVSPLRQPQQVTLQADCNGVLSGWVDGEVVEAKVAIYLLADAQLCGNVERLADEVPFVGKPAGRQLHILLGELGFKDHYGMAAEALGRPVTSLAHLTRAELVTVRAYAHGQFGLVG